MASNDARRPDDEPTRLFDKSSGDAGSSGSTDSRTTGGATGTGLATASANLFTPRVHESLPGNSQNGCVVSNLPCLLKRC